MMDYVDDVRRDPQFRDAIDTAGLGMWEEDLAAACVRCLLLVPDEDGPHLLGGTPRVGGDWPKHGRAPLMLLATFDLEALVAANRGQLDGLLEGLPDGGHLLLFCEHPLDPDPDFSGTDPDSWRVMTSTDVDLDDVEPSREAHLLEPLPPVRLNTARSWSVNQRKLDELTFEFDDDPLSAAGRANVFLGLLYGGSVERNQVGDHPVNLTDDVKDHATELHGVGRDWRMFAQFSPTGPDAWKLWGPDSRAYWLLPAGGQPNEMVPVIQRQF